MTKLTYAIVTTKGTVLKRGIETYEKAKELAAAVHGYLKEEYIPFEAEGPKFDRSKCKKSAAWLAAHKN